MAIKKPLAIIVREEVPTESEYCRKQGRRTFQYHLDDVATKVRLHTLTIVALPGDDRTEQRGNESDVMYASLYHIARGMGYRVVDALSGSLADVTRQRLHRAEKHNQEVEEETREYREWLASLREQRRGKVTA